MGSLVSKSQEPKEELVAQIPEPELAPSPPLAGTAPPKEDVSADVTQDESASGLAPDVAMIVQQGLNIDPLPPRLPLLQDAVSQLKEKYSINAASEPIRDRELELKAMLLGKRSRPTPASSAPAVKAASSSSESASSSSSSSSDSDSDSDSDSSSEAEPASKKRKVSKSPQPTQDVSDDEDEMTSSKVGLAAPRTEHEQEPEIVLPPIQVLPQDAGPLSLLGKVESIIDTVIVVKGTPSVSYDDQFVLDSGSLVCLDNRNVLGTVFEAFGPITAPCYAIRFPSPSDPNLAPITKGTSIYYPSNAQFANLVSTVEIKNASAKASDASNFWDEEPDEHEMEFSDDEAEMAYKRSLKEMRQQNKQKQTAAAVQPQSQRPLPTASVDELYYGSDEEKQLPVNTDEIVEKAEGDEGKSSYQRKRPDQAADNVRKKKRGKRAGQKVQHAQGQAHSPQQQHMSHRPAARGPPPSQNQTKGGRGQYQRYNQPFATGAGPSAGTSLPSSLPLKPQTALPPPVPEDQLSSSSAFARPMASTPTQDVGYDPTSPTLNSSPRSGSFYPPSAFQPRPMYPSSYTSTTPYFPAAPFNAQSSGYSPYPSSLPQRQWYNGAASPSSYSQPGAFHQQPSGYPSQNQQRRFNNR